jgi:glucose/arabinose dehydrogenase
MMHGRRALSFGLSGMTAATLGAVGVRAPDARGDIPMTAVRLQSGLLKPVFVTAPPGDTDRLFMLEQGNSTGTARVRILNLATNTFEANPLITITGLAGGNVGNEQGLLGMAFDPNFATNGYFYLNYTATGGSFGMGLSKIVRYTASGNTAGTSTAQLVMQYDQPQANHNGGWIGFGKDNYLYIATGDGGASNDTGTGHTTNMGNAQDLTKPLGKILRVDVSGDDFPTDSNKNYAIPKGGPTSPPKNPFYDNPATPTALPEIWHYGLRNPWRDSFDRKTGDLYIGDVGQGNREEVDFQTANSPGGLNYGWRIMEGNATGPGINDPNHAPLNTLTPPIFDYNHTSDAGIAVTGGYVYRGSENSALDGTYFFADYANGKIWTTKYAGSGTAAVRLIQNPQNGGGGTNAIYIPVAGTSGARIDGISSFGEDALGRLYITELGTNNSNGELFRLVPPVPGDANLDRIVNFDDLVLLAQNYNGRGGWLSGDFTDDGAIDFADLVQLAQNYNTAGPAAGAFDAAFAADLARAFAEAAVPEPSALAAGVIGVGLLLTRRRSQRSSGHAPPTTPPPIRLESPS